MKSFGIFCTKSWKFREVNVVNSEKGEQPSRASFVFSPAQCRRTSRNFSFSPAANNQKKVLKKSRISYSKATKHLFLDFGLWNPFFEAKKVSNDWRCHGVTKFANPKKGKWVIFFKNIKDMTIWQEILCCLIISHLHNFFGILDVT